MDPGAGVAPAAREVLAGDTPLLVANALAPRLGAAHAAVAVADLDDGADVSFGPGMTGGWYLLALREATDAGLGLLADDNEGIESGFALAAATGLEVGLLRAERLLLTAGDAAALAEDPLVAQAVRAALR